MASGELRLFGRSASTRQSAHCRAPISYITFNGGILPMVYSVRAADLTDKWSSPANDHSHDDDSVPTRWTAEYCQRRLLDAFRTDAALPRVNGPKQPGGAHPSVFNSPAEIAATENEIARMADVPSTSRRSRPTQAEIGIMERIFAWLAIVTDLVLRLALRDWLRTECSGRSHQVYCRERGVLFATFIYRKNEALAIVAAALNGRRVAVF
jgi:hypothetical protein